MEETPNSVHSAGHQKSALSTRKTAATHLKRKACAFQDSSQLTSAERRGGIVVTPACGCARPHAREDLRRSTAANHPSLCCPWFVP